MGFVIVREDGFFVAKPGLANSYTKDLRQIWVFKTKEEAERNRCPGNEAVVPLSQIYGM